LFITGKLQNVSSARKIDKTKKQVRENGRQNIAQNKDESEAQDKGNRTDFSVLLANTQTANLRYRNLRHYWEIKQRLDKRERERIAPTFFSHIFFVETFFNL
jgi:hypothetical protein